MRLLTWLLLLGLPCGANAQQLTSYSAGAGVTTQDQARPTAAFNVSVGFDWGLPWLIAFQRSVADLEPEPGGALRVSALSFGPAAQVVPSLMAMAGVSLLSVNEEWNDSARDRRTELAATYMVALQLPLAGDGVLLELSGRTDWPRFEIADALYTASLGVRIRPHAPRRLTRGEPVPAHVIAARSALWNDVLMQLILLEQSLESFERIKEIESGIELEFDQRSVTLYDDVAKVGRVLAAADPPVYVTALAPNAGRVAAAVTAGTFPPERIRLQRDNRVVLRVEH